MAARASILCLLLAAAAVVCGEACEAPACEDCWAIYALNADGSRVEMRNWSGSFWPVAQYERENGYEPLEIEVHRLDRKEVLLQFYFRCDFSEQSDPLSGVSSVRVDGAEVELQVDETGERPSFISAGFDADTFEHRLSVSCRGNFDPAVCGSLYPASWMYLSDSLGDADAQFAGLVRFDTDNSYDSELSYQCWDGSLPPSEIPDRLVVGTARWEGELLRLEFQGCNGVRALSVEAVAGAEIVATESGGPDWFAATAEPMAEAIDIWMRIRCGGERPTVHYRLPYLPTQDEEVQLDGVADEVQ